LIMWHSVKVFLFLPPLLFALDYVWLGIFASDLYKKLESAEFQPIR
jgi:hypothetical protein